MSDCEKKTKNGHIFIQCYCQYVGINIQKI